MKTTLLKDTASNYTVDNSKVEKLFWFEISHDFLSIIVDYILGFSSWRATSENTVIEISVTLFK